MAIQLVSDIHLEFYADDAVKPRTARKVPHIERDPSVQFLVLAGDIGYPFQEVYQLFLAQCSKDFPVVFVLAGNHELWHPGKGSKVRCYAKLKENRTAAQIKVQIEKVCCSFPNVYFLDRREMLFSVNRKLDSVTLLTEPDIGSAISHEQASDVHSIMKDYENIWVENPYGYGTPIHLTLEKMAEWHKEDRDWLLEKIQHASSSSPLVSTVIATHHAPSRRLSAIESNVSTTYCNDFPSCFFQAPVCLWLSGHTHECFDLCEYNDDKSHYVRLVSNCRDYRPVHDDKEFVNDYQHVKAIAVPQQSDSATTGENEPSTAS